MKPCCQCKTVKPLTDFHKRSGSPDGYQYICKECKRVKDSQREVSIKPKPNKSGIKRKFTEEAKKALGY